MNRFAILIFTSLLCALFSLKVSAQGEDPHILKYNNPTATSDLGVGLWGIPIPCDYNKDGLSDLLVSCPDRPYKGLYLFLNVGTAREPLFAPARKLKGTGKNNIRVSYVGGKPHVLANELEWINFFSKPYKASRKITYSGPRLNPGWNKSRSNMWSMVDWDGDGDVDIVVGIDTWDDYGWDNAYDSLGVWQNGPLHGYVHLLENQGGEYVNVGRILAGGKEIDTYGAPNPCVADFDGDGDFDIICGEFTDGLTWFENIGTRSEPVFAEGRRLRNKKGEIRFHIEMIVPVNYDFDGDGHEDLLVGDEDGRVAWVRNTGSVVKGMPQFESPVYLRQRADLLKFGALATPWACDWDGDGDEDIIAGNSAGEIAFIENLGVSKGEIATEESRPAWAEPRLFTCKGKPFRIQAGENGSIQGPAERKWGYTVLSVADWDGDGNLDIIINSIWGKIQWLRGRGSKKLLDLEEPRDILVEWDGEAPSPAWNWWKPSGKELVTQWRTTPVAIDWNKDGLMDLIVLDTEGYLAYFERYRKEDGTLSLRAPQRIFHCVNCSLYNRHKDIYKDPSIGIGSAEPGPLRLNNLTAGQSGRRKICFADWDGDGLLDLIVDASTAVWFKNLGENNFEYRGPIDSETNYAGHTTSPCPVDFDKDGRTEILLGAEDGHFYLFKSQE